MSTHTLTYNETTYTIEDGIVLSSILINGEISPWYLEYYPEGVLPGTAHIRLKNNTDKDKNSFYLSFKPTKLQFNDVVDIIKFCFYI